MLTARILLSCSHMLQDDLVRVSPPEGGSPIFVKSHLTAGLMTQGVPLQQAFAAAKAKSQALSDAESGDPEDETSSSPDKAPLMGQELSRNSLCSTSQKVPEVIASCCLNLPFGSNATCCCKLFEADP